MFTKQIFDFELRGSGPPGRTCTPKLVIFITKQKPLKEDLRVEYCFPAEILLEAMYLTSHYQGQITYKVYPKMQDFKRVLGLNCKQVKGGLNNLIFQLAFEC